MTDEVVCVGCGGAVEDDRQGYVKPVCHGCLPPPEPLPIVSRNQTARVLPSDQSEVLRVQIDKCTEMTSRRMHEFLRTLPPAEPGHVWWISLDHEDWPAGITIWFTARQRKLSPIEELDGAVPRFRFNSTLR